MPTRYITKRSYLSILFVISIVLVSFLSSCAPRGETKTMEEIYQIAKTRYEEAIVASKTAENTRAELANMIRAFTPFMESAAGSEIQESAKTISAALQNLMITTGYTTRPALGELISSYRGLALPEKEWSMNSATRKLLVSRTYTALAQELETTAFRVEPKGVR